MSAGARSALEAAARRRSEASSVDAAASYSCVWIVAEVILLLFQLLWRFAVLGSVGVQLSWPTGISVGVRLVGAALTCRRRATCARRVASMCLLVDVALLGTFHHAVGPPVHWGVRPPCQPSLFPSNHSVVAAAEESLGSDRDAGRFCLKLREAELLPAEKDREDLEVPENEEARLWWDKYVHVARELRALQLDQATWAKQQYQNQQQLRSDCVLVEYCLHMLIWFSVLSTVSVQHAMVVLPIGLGLHLVVIALLADQNHFVLPPVQEPLLHLTTCVLLFAVKVSIERSKLQVADVRVPSVARSIAASRSAASAPARMLVEAACRRSACHSGDCLPSDAEVWAEGSALPKPVGDVIAGERVLCLDSMGQTPKYVEVADVNFPSGAASWVDVVLADGTKLTMTADHPVRPQRVRSPFSFAEPHVKAAHLRPGLDCLSTMKMVNVPVESVMPRPASEAPVRVALLLKQPERHDLFVSPSGAQHADARVAVGSADAAVTEEDDPLPFVTTDHTFMEYAERGRVMTRCFSEPPPRRDASGDYALLNLRRFLIESMDAGSGASSDSRSTSFDAEVLVSFGNPPTVSSVSQAIAIRRLGHKSLGSSGHATGECQLCVFENKHQWRDRPPCFKGIFCERCHHDHPAFSRPTGAQRRLQARARSEPGPGPQGREPT